MSNLFVRLHLGVSTTGAAPEYRAQPNIILRADGLGHGFRV